MRLLWLFVSIGGVIGSYIPVMLGADGFSLWSILAGAIGSFVGIWAYHYFDF